MVKIICDICTDAFSLEYFRFFSCGHGLCGTCLEKTRVYERCTLCRQPKGDQAPHQVFLNFQESSPYERAKHVATCLDKIDVDSPSVSLGRAVTKIRNIVQRFDNQIPEQLSEAVQNLEQRLAPLSLLLERERTQNLRLESQLADVTRQAVQIEPLARQISRLQNQMSDAGKNYEMAVALAEKATAQVEAGRNENARLSELVEKQRKALSRKDEELQKAEVVLEQSERQVRLFKKKLKVLSKQGMRVQPRTQDTEESLLVEPPLKA